MDTPIRGGRLSAPQPAEPLESFANRRRQTISEARRTCQRVERLLEAASDALDEQIPAGSGHSAASGPAPLSTNIYQGYVAASAAAAAALPTPTPAPVSPKKEEAKDTKPSSTPAPPSSGLLSKAHAPIVISTRSLMRQAAAANSNAAASSRTLLSKEDMRRRPAEPEPKATETKDETLSKPSELALPARGVFNSCVSESSMGSSTIAAAQPPVAMQRNVPVNRPVIPTTPGAFAISGANAPPATVVHVEDIVPEVDEEEEEEDDEDEWNELDRILDVDDEEWNRLDRPNELRNQVVEANLVVAAKLASDVEDTIQAQVR